MRAYDWRLFLLANALLWLGVGVVYTQPPDYGDIARVTPLAWLGVAIHLQGVIVLFVFLTHLRLPRR